MNPLEMLLVDLDVVIDIDMTQVHIDVGIFVHTQIRL
jgi:hypothetical protein